jgi:threonine/homoserine/homoserine lactone efflux protein
MPDFATLTVFAVATAALLLVPGPSVLFVVARTLEHGRRGGLVSLLGVETGALLHVGAATLGVSALIAASPAALTAVRVGGAIYLVAMGIASLRSRADALAGAGSGEPAAHRRLFRQGLVVDALNPKTAMFFLAFLPQFVDPARGSVAAQTAVLGFVFVALATLNDAAYALLAGALANRLRRSVSMRRRLRRASGAIYLGLGALAGAAPA